MSSMKLILLSLLVTGCASAPLRPAPLAADPQFGTITPASQVDTVMIPQWHLAPMTNTVSSSAGLPQEENQRAIYRQLVAWVEGGSVKTAIVEGCEGEINDGFTTRFNGWTLADLQALSAEQLDNVLTHIGLKLKAKMGQKIRVVCGDDDALVKKHQLILSDLRGLVGFRVRIDQYKDDIVKRADYVAGVRDILKLPKDADEVDVIKKLDGELRAKVTEFNSVLHERDASFVRIARGAQPVDAIVIGAVHLKDLEAQLHAAGLSTQTFTPKGLKGDEAELMDQIQALLTK